VTGPRVEVFVASLNTCTATELAIRSLRALDRSTYEIVVGDGGSSDGSVAMLTRLQARGWVRLYARSDKWGHHDWIEWRIAHSEADYVVFCDSDIEFRAGHAIRDLVATAAGCGAAMVASEFCRAGPGVEPVSGAAIHMAERPGVWLFLVAPSAVREIATSFAFRLEPVGASGSPAVAYDTGADWFRELVRRDIPWASMSGLFTRRYRHHSGLTWRPLLGVEDKARAVAIHDRMERRLRRLRARQDATSWVRQCS
jgi:glycosyltransferase involved in cell wall biosynthesis